MIASTEAAEARQRLLAGMPLIERRLELGGISTVVLEGGSGPPIVVLHGPGEHAAKWFPVLPDLTTTHRVIAPDLPGHGDTVVSDGILLDADCVLGWLGELIERMCPTPPILLGHAVGGAIAARFAALHPDRIRQLVLVDTLGLVPFAPAPEFQQAMMAFITQPSEETQDRLWEQCAFDLDRLRKREGERWDWMRAYNLDRARTPRLQTQQHALMTEFGFPAISAEVLGRIDVPTTLIWGRHDLATRVQVALTATARYGWPLRIIDDAGADPPMEQPEAFLAELRAAQRVAADAATQSATIR
jgi:pimeloyl-ACP methyl ester carboxylesterase